MAGKKFDNKTNNKQQSQKKPLTTQNTHQKMQASKLVQAQKQTQQQKQKSGFQNNQKLQISEKQGKNIDIHIQSPVFKNRRAAKQSQNIYNSSQQDQIDCSAGRQKQEQENQRGSASQQDEQSVSNRYTKKKPKSKSKSKFAAKSLLRSKSKANKTPIFGGKDLDYHLVNRRCLRQKQKRVNHNAPSGAQSKNKVKKDVFIKMQKELHKAQEYESLLISSVQCSVKVGIYKCYLVRLKTQENVLVREADMLKYFPRKLMQFYKIITNRVARSTQQIKLIL